MPIPLLHAGAHAAGSTGAWIHPLPLALALALLLAAYVWCVGPGRRRLGGGAIFPAWRSLSFLCGALIFYAGVASPLDHVGETYLFWVHMAQHMLFIFPVPVLLLIGLPPWLAAAIFDRKGLRPFLRFLTAPLIAWILFHLFFLGWHLPALYEAALASAPLHYLEHATMVGGSLLAWWPLLNPVPGWPRMAFGARLLYIFAFPVAQLPLFAILAFSDEVLYPTYLIAPRLEGWLDISPLEDQQLGGIIMKFVAMAVYTAVWACTFFSWSSQHHKKNPSAEG